jgi:hypothetical protein
MSEPDITYFHAITEKRVDGLPALRAIFEEYRGRLLFDSYEMADPKVQWQASRFDGGKHHRLPVQATVADRLRKSSPCMEAAGILRRICAPSSGLCDCITWR